MVSTATATTIPLDAVKPADQARHSKIQSEFVVIFADAESHDIIKSYASGLANSKGAAGLRLDIPPCLKGSFKILSDHGLAMIKVYGKEVKRNIRFDDRNEDPMMDIKLPTSNNWHNITIDQAREARKAREIIDMRNIRRAALGATNQSMASIGYDREKARALMLAGSPGSGAASGGASRSGVVHINSSEDWRAFENNDEDNASDRSIEEILGSRSAGGGGARRKTNTNTNSSQQQ